MKTYEMYNGFNSNLFSDDEIIEAKSSADACRKLLNKIGVKYTKIIRDKSNLVMIKAQPFKLGNDGVKYKDGNISWFTIYNGDEILQ